MTLPLAVHRLGITGSAGTGKSTLAAAAARALGVPLVPEAMRAMLESGFDFHTLTRQGHMDLLRTQTDSLARTLAATEGGIVTDRTPLDFAAFWLSNGYGIDAPAATAALLERAVAAMADYSAVILLPWGGFAPPADGVRSQNPWHQLHFQTIVEGLCRRWVPPERLWMPPETPNVSGGMAAWVLDRIVSVPA